MKNTNIHPRAISMTCPACDGEGRVYDGANDPYDMGDTCETCGGYEYIELSVSNDSPESVILLLNDLEFLTDERMAFSSWQALGNYDAMRASVDTYESALDEDTLDKLHYAYSVV